MNLAIIIGVEKYDSSQFKDLPACHNDAETFNKVIKSVKEFDDILYLNSNERGQTTKGKISKFIEKYKDKPIDEFLFYFSGHGERDVSDLFYLMSDYEQSKKETTGLRNSELDGMIRSLSPNLCIKIIDSCFSGTQYIKSEYNEGDFFKKSAEKNKLNNLYFWFSSEEDKESLAGSEFSKFTESIFTAILEYKGDVRYLDISAYVADDLSSNTNQKPFFVSQANNTELFGHITEETHQIILDAFGLPEESNTENKSNNAENDNILLNLVKSKHKEVCFKKERLDEFLLNFKEIFNSNDNWPNELKDLYKIGDADKITSNITPNSKGVGTWLEKNKEKGFFLRPQYKTDQYKTEEYVKKPLKPSNIATPRGYRDSIMGLGFLGGYHNDDDYKLVEVSKTRQVIDGFQYFDEEKNIIRLKLEPKFEILNFVEIYIIPIYSNSKFIFNYSYEKNIQLSWNYHSDAKCEDWKILDININLQESAKLAATHIINEISQWLLADIKKNF
ncbi:MAG: caspase family protein [Candidatus Thiocaldithrix dubininis]|uniref:Caspase family protein n=1 Tax=Candidatus Thiocaldithrix dubininis TaxID=3080823 RepID=A0AA95KFM0_9GAMM|nr:MAG: caspase family protein [Candidatus Thiocaldithrix dubininis]